MFLLLVSVTHIQWYDEDKRFAVGFSDGIVCMCSKETFEEPQAIEAHEVSQFNTILEIRDLARTRLAATFHIF